MISIEQETVPCFTQCREGMWTWIIKHTRLFMITKFAKLLR